jgi:hypothetical protein
VQDHLLFAAQAPARAVAAVVAFGARGDVAHVVARLALTERAGQLEFARRHLLQQGAVAAAQLQEFGAQHGREIGFDDQAAAQLLHHHEHVDGVAVEAALRLRHRQRRQAQLRERGPGLRRGAAGRLHDRAARLEAVVARDPALERVGQLQLLFLECEVHCLFLTVPGSSGR